MFKSSLSFNHFACFWPKCYQRGSLGKSHQKGDYLKQAMQNIVSSQDSNLQPLACWSTAPPLELEKKFPRVNNFGYLNPATFLFYGRDRTIKFFAQFVCIKNLGPISSRRCFFEKLLARRKHFVFSAKNLLKVSHVFFRCKSIYAVVKEFLWNLLPRRL